MPGRSTFFSFHYERDVWRASIVRNSGVDVASERAGILNHRPSALANRCADQDLSYALRDVRLCDLAMSLQRSPGILALGSLRGGLACEDQF